MQMVQPSGHIVYVYRGGIPPSLHVAERHGDAAICGFEWNPDRDDGGCDVAWLPRAGMCQTCREWADDLEMER